MTNIVQDKPSIEGFVLNRRDRRCQAEARLLEYIEIAEARRIKTRMQCGRGLGDVAIDELSAVHERITDRTTGDPAFELDLRDIERLLKRGYGHLLNYYLEGRW